MVLQTKLLSQTVSKLSSSVCSLQQKASDNDDNNKKFPTLSICPKTYPFSVAILSGFLLMLIQTTFSYPVWLYNVCKDYFKGVKNEIIFKVYMPYNFFNLIFAE
jgi:hypothetical protein